MANYLIGYIEPKENNYHEDPLLKEYTYGDVNENGRKLRNNVNNGDYLFFHRTIRGKRYLTAFYVVEKVMTTSAARNDSLIKLKFKNPHLLSDDVIDGDTLVFGNPITSNILERPLELTKDILNKFSRRPNFNPNQTELAAITSALRTWKELSQNDVNYLLEKIEKRQEKSYLSDTYLSSEEIKQIEESDIEKFLAMNPQVFGNGLKVYRKQLVLDDNSRLDLLLINEKTNELIVVEIKRGSLGKEVYKQISNYIKQVKKKLNNDKVRGIIVGSDVLPIYEDYYVQKINEGKISVFLYAWKFSVRDYIRG